MQVLTVSCVWEHNGNDTLLHVLELPGAYTRGCSLEEAELKLEKEVKSYLSWMGKPLPDRIDCDIVQDIPCNLEVSDADSDALFDAERLPLSGTEYEVLKSLALRSAESFQRLYNSISAKEESSDPVRNTFYGAVPRTAGDMYRHTKNVNAYYFGELNVEADNEGTIWECRARGFSALEALPDFLNQPALEGSYGEFWSLRKLLRRFIWHDRIHAKAMFRMARRNGFANNIDNAFCFEV